MLRFPGRKVVTRSPHRRVGYVSSPWFQSTQIPYESLLEQSFIRLALLCPGVRSVTAQPFYLDLPDGTRYTPDFLLELDYQKKLVVEVKPRVFIEKHKEKLDLANQILAEDGHEFLVADDVLIKADGRDGRASMILRYARSHDVPEIIQRSQDALAELSRPTPMEQFMQLTQLQRHQVLALVGRRYIQLAPDLSDEVLFPSQIHHGDDYGCLSGAAWFGHCGR